MSSAKKILSRDDIVDATGIKSNEEYFKLKQLEILFTAFDEIDSLFVCPNIQLLSLIDNGLKTISNLSPISSTLTVLRLCDQDINSLEFLECELPRLEELYLHRNNISSISNNPKSLRNISNIKNLWLSQNKISVVPSNLLIYLTNLEELRIESNNISDLDFLLGCVPSNSTTRNIHPLKILGLSGNPITDIRELLKLRTFSSLSELIVQDIHYGVCPLLLRDEVACLPKPLNSKESSSPDEEEVDELWYRDFIIANLPQVKIVDGIKIQHDRVEYVRRALHDERMRHEAALRSIEDSYQHTIQNLVGGSEAKESHLLLLEREMTRAFSSLQELVEKGKVIITDKLQAQRESILSIHSAHDSELSDILQSTRHQLQQQLLDNIDTFDNLYASIHQLIRIFQSAYQLLSIFNLNSTSHMSIIPETSSKFSSLAKLLKSNPSKNISITLPRLSEVELMILIGDPNFKLADADIEVMYTCLSIRDIDDIVKLSTWEAIKSPMVMSRNPALILQLYMSSQTYIDGHMPRRFSDDVDSCTDDFDIIDALSAGGDSILRKFQPAMEKLLGYKLQLPKSPNQSAFSSPEKFSNETNSISPQNSSFPVTSSAMNKQILLLVGCMVRKSLLETCIATNIDSSQFTIESLQSIPHNACVSLSSQVPPQPYYELHIIHPDEDTHTSLDIHSVGVCIHPLVSGGIESLLAVIENNNSFACHLPNDRDNKAVVSCVLKAVALYEDKVRLATDQYKTSLLESIVDMKKDKPPQPVNQTKAPLKQSKKLSVVPTHPNIRQEQVSKLMPHYASPISTSKNPTSTYQRTNSTTSTSSQGHISSNSSVASSQSKQLKSKSQNVEIKSTKALSHAISKSQKPTTKAFY